MPSHDDEVPRTARQNPANRLSLDYHAAPPAPGPIVDIHSHVRLGKTLALFFDAAATYGVTRVISMSPLEHVDELLEVYRGRLDFIAVPRWREFDTTAKFREHWLADLLAFREKGVRVMKFWMAPPMRGEHGLTLDHAFLRPVIDAALDLGYHFMTHIADPSIWFLRGQRYGDAGRYGTKADQYPQLEYFLDAVAPRCVIGAHMGGYIEDPNFLQGLLDRHPNYLLDSSATKWIVREVSRQPQRVREFMLRNQDRILFGSDLVTDDGYDFDHYASRYWAQRTMWETTYRGESPIDDPDAPQPPQLAGVDLPADVLRKLYWENARRLGLWEVGGASAPSAQ